MWHILLDRWVVWLVIGLMVFALATFLKFLYDRSVVKDKVVLWSTISLYTVAAVLATPAFVQVWTLVFDVLGPQA